MPYQQHRKGKTYVEQYGAEKAQSVCQKISLANTGRRYGYCQETNTVYEVYESFHRNQTPKDTQRETKICKHLGCNFVVIWDGER